MKSEFISMRLRQIITDRYKRDNEKIDLLFKEYISLNSDKHRENSNLFLEALLMKYDHTNQGQDQYLPFEKGENSILLAARMNNILIAETLIKLSELSLFPDRKFAHNYIYLRETYNKNNKIFYENSLINSQNELGDSVLSIFIKNKANLDFIIKLINLGADINIKNQNLNSTILSDSISSNNQILTRLLLNLDLKPEIHLSSIVVSAAGPEVKIYETVFEILLKRLKIENIKNRKLFFSNLLLSSAFSCNELIIKKILENGAEVNHVDHKNTGFLHIISQNIRFEKLVNCNLNEQVEIGSTFSLEIVENILLKANSNLRAIKEVLKCSNLLDKKDYFGRTPLQIAITNRNMPMLVFLVEQGANLFFKNRKNLTLLDVLSLQENIEKLDINISENPERNFSYMAKKYTLERKDVKNQTLITRYILEENFPMVETLLSAGRKIFSNKLEDNSLLELAEKTENPEIISIVKKYSEKSRSHLENLSDIGQYSPQTCHNANFMDRSKKDRAR